MQQHWGMTGAFMILEGLFKTLKDDEVRDLIANLRTTTQVPLLKQ